METENFQKKILKKKWKIFFEKKFSNKFWYFWASKYKTFGFFLHSLSIWYNIWCPYVPMGITIIQTLVLGKTGIACFPKSSVLGKMGIVNDLLFCKRVGKSRHGHALYHHYPSPYAVLAFLKARSQMTKLEYTVSF